MMSRPALRAPSSPLSLCVLLVSSWIALSGAAQSQTTVPLPTVGGDAEQSVELESGANFVSLSVYPETSSLEVLFGDDADRIFLVKDSEGTIWAPRYGLHDLKSWDWDRSYLVYVRDPVNLTVTGKRIKPVSSVSLKAGWSWVPYFGTEPISVEEGFASLGDNLTRVEDVDGRVYPASGRNTPLATLEPGKGYRVHLKKAATLVYDVPDSPPSEETTPPTTPAPPPEEEPPAEEPQPTAPERITVASIAEALALKDLAPGQIVEVGGYYTDGDGGGGTFDVTASGMAPNGGTVFVPDQYVSGVVTETHRYRHDQRLEGVPAGQDVVYGTLRIDVLDGSGTVQIEFPDYLLHGHTYHRSASLFPGVQYEEGRTSLYKNRIEASYGRDVPLRYTYRHTTSDLRLERAGVEGSLYVEWFGGRPASKGANWTGSTDVQPILCQVLNVASARNTARSGDINSVVFSHPAVYDYYGSVIVPDGVTVRGQGGTSVQTVTNDLGHTYRPVRVKSRHTRLRVMDGQALRHLRMNLPSSDPYHLPLGRKWVLDGHPTSLWVGHGAMSAGIADLVLDGNWEENQQAWTEGWASYNDLETWGRNSPGHAGFVSTSHGGVRVPQGQVVMVHNVAIEGFISNGLLGNANNTWEVENVRLGNSLWNHVLYNANGSYTNLTLHGFAWGHAAWGAGRISNLVFEDGAVGPRRRGKEVMGIRGGDAYDPTDLAGEDGYFTREDGTVPSDLGTDISGFYLDLRGSGLSEALNGLGPNVRIRGASRSEPGRIITDPDATFKSVYSESGNGYQRSLYPSNHIEDVVVYDTGSGKRGSLIHALNVTESTFRNVWSDRSLVGGSGRVASALEFNARHRGRSEWDNVQTVTYDEIREEAPHHFIAKVSVDGDAVGRDVVIRRSAFNNASNTLFRGPSGGGALSTFDGDPSKLRVYLDDVKLNLHGKYFSNLELFFAMSRFRDVTDIQSGNTSEDNGRASFTGGGEDTYLDVPTRLLWAPQDPSYVNVTSSLSGLVKSVEVIRSASGSGDWRAPTLRVYLTRALRVGERVTLDWSAAVRPIPPGTL